MGAAFRPHAFKNGSGSAFQADDVFYFGGSAPFGHSSHNSPL